MFDALKTPLDFVEAQELFAVSVVPSNKKILFVL